MHKLIICGTPIGNLEDVSIRQIKTIFETSIVLAEDTRSYHKLKGLLKEKFLGMFKSLGVNVNQDVKQKVYSYREQNHNRALPEILEHIKTSDLVLVADAGMPAISDPGWKLIHELIERGIEIDIIPGATALTSALLLSGLPTDRFTFVGFLPRKRKKIQELINPFLELQNTVIFYESPFRIKKSINTLKELFSANTQVSLIGEITKKFQSVYRGTLGDIEEEIGSHDLRGEWVGCLRSSK